MFPEWNQFAPLGPVGPGYVSLAERDPDSSPDHEMHPAQAAPQDAMDIDCPCDYFTRCFDNCSLPGDSHASGPFDNRSDFSLGDPGADYEGNNKCEYATSGAVGEPHWPQLVLYLLQHCVHVRYFNTVFVLVDNRDLTTPKTEQESLAHWPTVEAWWASRLALHGPGGELCDLVYIPINQAAGLEHVHPTWAGTFVLAAFVFLFPGVHFVLLDSDCVPVTLFEVADLWKEISLLQNGLVHATASCPEDPVPGGARESVTKASKLSHDRWHHQIIGQGVLLVTEHNAEVNAGFIVAFASSHRSAVREDQWKQISEACSSTQEINLLQHEADRLANLYWDYVSDFLDSRRPLAELDSVECAAWVQSGLALAPFAGCVTKYTCDWTIAWSLIGEWTSSGLVMGTPRTYWKTLITGDHPYSRGLERVLSKGLAGSALVCVLPGDRMFQAQRLVPAPGR